MPMLSGTITAKPMWKVTGTLLSVNFPPDRISLLVEIDTDEAAYISMASRALVDARAGTVVECQMPIRQVGERMCLLSWSGLNAIRPNFVGGMLAAKAGSRVELWARLSPYRGPKGWNVTAFASRLEVLVPASEEMTSRAEIKPEPKPAHSRYEPRQPGHRHAGIPAPEAPEPVAGSVSQRAVLAIVPKSGLLRSSKPGSMPRLMPSLQPGRRRELYAANRGVR